MRISFLGTGAAIHIRKPNCEMKDGERRCSSVLIDESILVDLPFQAYDFAVEKGIDTSKITDVFLTHSHDDHFQKKTLADFAASAKNKLTLWCQKDALENLELGDDELSGINVRLIDAMEKIEVGGATVTALYANHMTKGAEKPLHYIFEKDGKSLLYGCDGGWFVAPTWEYLRKLRLDGAVLDATVGDDPGNFRIGTHNSIPMLKIIIAALYQNGVMDEKGKLIANHIAPSVYKMSESEIEEALGRIGMITARDGMEIEI